MHAPLYPRMHRSGRVVLYVSVLASVSPDASVRVRGIQGVSLQSDHSLPKSPLFELGPPSVSALVNVTGSEQKSTRREHQVSYL